MPVPVPTQPSFAATSAQHPEQAGPVMDQERLNVIVGELKGQPFWRLAGQVGR